MSVSSLFGGPAGFYSYIYILAPWPLHAVTFLSDDIQGANMNLIMVSIGHFKPKIIRTSDKSMEIMVGTLRNICLLCQPLGPSFLAFFIKVKWGSDVLLLMGAAEVHSDEQYYFRMIL